MKSGADSYLPNEFASAVVAIAKEDYAFDVDYSHALEVGHQLLDCKLLYPGCGDWLVEATAQLTALIFYANRPYLNSAIAQSIFAELEEHSLLFVPHYRLN